MFVALAAPAGAAGTDAALAAMLVRLSEEAEAFRALAPRAVGRETLWQKARINPGPFRIRAGEAARKPPEAKYRDRGIVSEYGFSTLAADSEALIEFRAVLRVDGRTISEASKARSEFVLKLKNGDDRAKRGLLRSFERLGLRGAATDFGQMILLFRRSALEGYSFLWARRDRIGEEAVNVIAYQQRAGPASLTIFRGRDASRVPLRGEVWLRDPDHLPLRITVTAHASEGARTMAYEGRVDYRWSPFGMLLPSTVEYRQTVDAELLVEIVARYDNFLVFTVDSQINFSPEDFPAGVTPPAPQGPPAEP